MPPSVDWSALRGRFTIPPDTIYLDGNSLGLPCRDAEAALRQALDAWRSHGIAGWFGGERPWLAMAREVATLTAPLVGAEPTDVIATGSVTVNLHQGLSTLFKPDGERRRIVLDDTAFPTDSYAVASHLRLRGLDPADDLVRVPAGPDGFLEESDLIDAIERPDVAAAVLPVVVYSTGQLIDVERVTAAARRAGVVVLWDASHAVGSVPLKLNDWGCDYAVWCGYKYLNGGPGCVAGLFRHARHAKSAPGLAGWFGSSEKSMFAMPSDLDPADDAGRLQLGTPHVLSLAPLLGSLRPFAEVGMDAIRARSLELTSHLLKAFDRRLSAYGFTLKTPRSPDRRGGHITLRHPSAKCLVDRLAEHAVVLDYREPSLIRVAPAALYNTIEDIDRFIVLATGLISEEE